MDTSASAVTNSGSFGALVSGNRSAMSSLGTAVTSGGKSGDYMNFPYGNDGTNGRAYFNVNPEDGSDTASIFNHTQSWTFEVFFKIGQVYSNSNPFILFKMNSSGAEYIQAYVPAPYAANPGKLIILMSGSTTNLSLSSTSRLDDNAWHHMALVHTASTGTDLYIDGTLNQSLTHGAFGQQYKLFDRYSTLNIGADASSPGSYAWCGGIDDFLIYDYALTSTQVAGNYASVNSTPVSYTATAATASALAVDPTISTTKTVNYSHTVSTASALAVDPTVSTIRNINIDGGGVATASADSVTPTISAIRNVDYSHSAATASATSPSATITTTKIVNYSAAPATASALFSSNLFFGKAERDTSYDIHLRQLTTAPNINQNVSNGTAYIGVQYGASGSVASYSHLALKESSGLAANNEIIKVKFDTSAVSVSGVNSGDGFKVNVYVFTSNPSSGTFETMLPSQMGTKELIYQKRVTDDGNGTNIDLTPAFADSRAKTYGILLEMDPWWNDTGSYADENTYKRIEITGSNKDSSGFYVLSSNIVNKNVNADISTASALMVDAVITTTRTVNYTATAATATATSVTPTYLATRDTTISAAVSTASALALQPTFFRTVSYPAPYAEAFGTTVTPTVVAVRSAIYTATAATADAYFHMPQFNIGEANSSDHMDASATMVHPTVVINKSVTAAVMTASATAVTATAQPVLNGLVLANTMTASAQIVSPPAYKTLFSDKWYSLLYSQHAQKHNVRVTNGGNGEAILKLFDDVTVNKTAGTSISNNLTQTITTDGIVEGDTAPVMAVTAEFNPPENTPILEKGYFDDYERKAVRFNNISTGYENSEYSKFGFTFELSIKTTKSDQIIAVGKTRSFYGYQQSATTYGLSDGKLFLTSNQTIGPAPLLHAKEVAASGVFLGNKRIDDGQWHHIVIQSGWDDNRVQFWIDGNLDKQKIGGSQLLDGPSFLGFNAYSSTYTSDFYTSAWSYDSNNFIREYDIDSHTYSYIKYNPILADPMLGSATSGDATATSNKGRALMLYWWPTDDFQTPSLISKQFNLGSFPNDIDTFDNELSTADFIKNGPQDYYGWDIFPVDITGYFVSDLVKPAAYGGPEHIKIGSKAFIGTGQNYNQNPTYLYNDQGTFRDPVTDAARYIDLIKDVDLRNFDAIFFKNFPDDTKEREAYSTNEDVDTFFGVKELKLYEDFLVSLRAAVDTGVSLYVTNPQLAIDLGIVNRIEEVPDMDDLVGYDSDPYAPTVVPGASSYQVNTGDTSNGWADTYKNNRLRVVNLVPGLTDQLDYIYKDVAIYLNDDAIEYGEANRPYYSVGYKPDGLQVGDEIIHANYIARYGKNNYLAVPFANVKVGTIVLAFANNVRRGLDLIENPYKNYATCIVVKPGDVLNGKQVGGKIFVNFTETINNAYEDRDVDLISDFWINKAYEAEAITLQQKTAYLAATYNINRQLEANAISQAQFNELFYWSSNGNYILSQANVLQDEEKQATGKGNKVSNKVRKINKRGGLSYTSVPNAGQFFSFSYSYQYPRATFEVPSSLTLGFRWLSNREVYTGLVNRPIAMESTATMPMPVVVAQKSAVVYAQAMSASATINTPVGIVNNNVNNISLPMEAFATFTPYVTKYAASPMVASAILRTNVIASTTAVDEVVLYVMHTDPILYLREDVIK